MTTLRTTLIPFLALLLAAPAPAAVHDDDPKILDAKLPYRGPGYQRSQRLQASLLEAPGGKAESVALNFPCSEVTLLSWLVVADLGGTSTSIVNDCWGYVSPSGREYALVGISNGTAFVDITQPSAPVVVSFQPGPISNWRDIKVYGEYAYSVSEGGDGIQVFDLSQIDQGAVTFTGNVTAGGATTRTHNVAIDEVSGFLYRCGGTFHGLRIYDLADPANPTFVSEWNDRYCHDAQVVTYTSGPYAGRQIAFVCSGLGSLSTGVEILDVTDKSNIQLLSQTSYSTMAYSHQGWLSDDRQYFYINDESDEPSVPSTTIVMDVSDLENPFEASTFTNGLDSVTHNNYIRGDLFFASNYTSGLRVFDLSVSPTNPPEVAFFDTAETTNAATFNGLWSNYPLLPSGVVIGSDREKGLFVWHLGAPTLEFDFPEGVPTVVAPNGTTMLRVQINELKAGELNAATVNLHYNIVGFGIQLVPMTALGSGLFEAALPATDCGDVAEFYVSAQSSNGVAWFGPENAPDTLFSAPVSLDGEVVLTDDMESPSGWTVGSASDTATSGLWESGDPVGTLAQPEDDHSPVGDACWFTGQHTPGGNLGDSDVDGGKTTLSSPLLDVSELADPWISYWRWYSNDQGDAPNEDVLRVRVNDGSSGWVNVEVVGPAGGGSVGGWLRREFRVADYVTPSATVQVRFIARDDDSPSIVEAAIDDLQVFDGVCQELSADEPAVSLSSGGAQSLQLAAGAELANEFYWILGSSTGTSPGLPLGAFVVPVTVDAYTLITLTESNLGILVDTFGTLDEFGKASAAIAFPPGANPNLAGLTLHHAFFAFDLGAAQVLSASNSVSLDLVP